MSTAKNYRDIENVFRGIADAAAKLAELEESGRCKEEEIEAAMKDFTWALAKMQAI